MGRCRVLVPEVVRLTISDGDYLDVKKTLNAGEYRDLMANMAGTSHFGERAIVDLRKVGIAKVLQYLVGWSLVGIGEKPLPYSLEMPEDARIATLRGLERETFSEILDAVDAHEERVDQEREARKNAQAAGNGSSVISTSAA